MSKPGIYLPLTWSEEYQTMGVFIPVAEDKLNQSVQGPAEKRLFIVETLSTYRHRYAVYADNEDAAYQAVADESVDEMSQLFLGEVNRGITEVTEQQYLTMFDEDNDYLKSWDADKKLSFITEV